MNHFCKTIALIASVCMLTACGANSANSEPGSGKSSVQISFIHSEDSNHESTSSVPEMQDMILHQSDRVVFPLKAVSDKKTQFPTIHQRRTVSKATHTATS